MQTLNQYIQSWKLEQNQYSSYRENRAQTDATEDNIL